MQFLPHKNRISRVGFKLRPDMNYPMLFFQFFKRKERADIRVMVQLCNRNIKGENLLLVFTIIGVFIGVGVGVGLNIGKVDLTPRQEAYLSFPGEIFLRLLKMLILPLMCALCIFLYSNHFFLLLFQHKLAD